MGRRGQSVTREQRLHRQRGATLLESIFTMVLVVMVVGAAMQATLAMTRSSGFGERRVDLLARADQATLDMAAELRLTDTFGDDPVTGVPYVTITGVTGDEVINFRRVLAFAESNSEVVPVWSTPIEYRIVNNQLIRRQDGADQVLLRNAQALDFEIDSLGRIRMTVQVDSLGGAITDGQDRRTLTISPIQGV